MNVVYDWKMILPRAVVLHRQEQAITGIAPTLRRLHYALFSDAIARAAGYANTQNCYKRLSDVTARARDEGTFPALDDRGRAIEFSRGAFGMPDIAAEVHRRAQFHTLDRSSHLDVNVLLLAEKDAVMPLLGSRYSWFARAAVRGYSSITHADRIAELGLDDRDTIALYVGDYDPSGLDISRWLADRMPFEVRRVALTREHVDTYRLPQAPAKSDDSRTKGMIRDTGEAMQVELDALPPQSLFAILDEAIQDVSGVTLLDDGTPDLPDVDSAQKAQRKRLKRLSKRIAKWQENAA